MKCKVCWKDHHDYGIKPAPVVTIGTNADKTYTASDLASAEEKGRREIADIVINAVLDIETTPRENWPSARDLLAKITQDCGLQSEVFPLLNMCHAKEAGDDN